MEQTAKKQKPLSEYEHPHAECIRRNKGKGITDIDAYCASVVDKIKGTTKWRGPAEATTKVQIRKYASGYWNSPDLPGQMFETKNALIKEAKKSKN